MYTGKLIKLRAYKKEELPLVVEYINDPEVKRNVNPGIPYIYTLEDEEKWYENCSASNDTYHFAIETLDTREYIGGCGINEVDFKNSKVTIGIFIGNKEYWGKGYGTDAIKTLTSFIFDQMNINKIKLSVYAFNKRAMRCYEKCGFKVEGTLHQELFRDGAYHDEFVMALLREDYIKQ